MIASTDSWNGSQAHLNLDYLLLGDLLEILEEPARDLQRRWLLAILDMLLARSGQESRNNSDSGIRDVLRVESYQLRMNTTSLLWGAVFRKFAKLRDRLAHRSEYQALAHEICCLLRRILNSRPIAELPTSYVG